MAYREICTRRCEWCLVDVKDQETSPPRLSHEQASIWVERSMADIVQKLRQRGRKELSCIGFAPDQAVKGASGEFASIRRNFEVFCFQTNDAFTLDSALCDGQMLYFSICSMLKRHGETGEYLRQHRDAITPTAQQEVSLIKVLAHHSE